MEPKSISAILKKKKGSVTDRGTQGEPHRIAVQTIYRLLEEMGTIPWIQFHAIVNN